MSDDDGRQIDGFRAVVEMMGVMDGPSRDRLLKDLAQKDPRLVERIREELFQFEDFAKLESQDLRTVLSEVSHRQLAVAFRLASDSLKQAFYSALSKRGADDLKEEVESCPPQRQSDVVAAQKAIVEMAKKMEEEGKISMPSLSEK